MEFFIITFCELFPGKNKRGGFDPSRETYNSIRLNLRNVYLPPSGVSWGSPAGAAPSVSSVVPEAASPVAPVPSEPETTTSFNEGDRRLAILPRAPSPPQLEVILTKARSSATRRTGPSSPSGSPGAPPTGAASGLAGNC